MKIIDFHVHLPVEGFDPQFVAYRRRYQKEYGAEKLAVIDNWSREYDRQWRRSWNFPDPGPPLPPGEGASLWFDEARKHRLEQVVLVTGGGNEALAEAIAPYRPRLVGFAHHHPQEKGAPASLEKAVTEYGFKGYKIFAPLVEMPLGDPSLRPLWAAAERHRLPVLIHFGILGGGGGIASGTNINPLSLEPVAKGYPGISFVVPHFGCGYPRELLQLCWSAANVYVDTSGNNEWIRWHPGPLTLEELSRRFYETIGPERIIFGSDSSWFPRGFARAYLETQLELCRRLQLPEGDLELIFGGNARRLLEGVRHA